MRCVGPVLLLSAVAMLLACGGGAPPTVARPDYTEAHWQDVFDTTPELLLILRPRALRRDNVYGPLLRRALETARERSLVVSATPLDAIEDADEVILGVRPAPRNPFGEGDPDDHGEGVVVMRGVRADLDPGHLVDADGRSLWTPGPSGAVRELLREKDEHGNIVAASLFELPGRTWVIATGNARPRARDSFAHPVNRPALRLDPDALAVARFDGPSLVAHVQPLQQSGSLTGLTHKLRSLTAELPPGTQRALRVTLSYVDEGAAGVAQITMSDLIDALAHARPPPFPWLASARVERRQADVVVAIALSAELMDALLHVPAFDPL